MVETISTSALKFTRECDECGQRRTVLYLHRNGTTAYCEGCYIQYRREADGAMYSSIDGIMRTEREQEKENHPAAPTAAPGAAADPGEPETAQFLVRLDLAHLEETTGNLRRLGIDFDPVDSMVCLPPEMALEAIFTGQDMEQVIRAANLHLEERGESHRFHVEFWRMPPTTRRDLMALLTLHSDWDEGRSINEMNEEEWKTFREKHPEAVTTGAS